ncbi:MAG TPA: transposase [Anaerolineales bacterium]
MLPPIPENTIRAARASYGKGHVYLRLGDRVNDLLSSINSDLLAIQSDGYFGTLLAALTIVQYVEGLTDTELTESLHGRLDLRYALHLPSPGPRFDPFTLCAFRQKVLKDQKYHLLFEEIFKVLYPELGADELRSNPAVCTVINSICVNTMRGFVVEAMFHAIEALSANHFNWLRQVALPHWYERYSHSLLVLDSGLSIRQKEYTIDDLRIDIQYLLQAVDQSNSQKINEIPEVKTLRHVWSKLLHYKPEDQCAYCFNNSFERRSTFHSTNENSSQAR